MYKVNFGASPISQSQTENYTNNSQPKRTPVVMIAQPQQDTFKRQPVINNQPNGSKAGTTNTPPRPNVIMLPVNNPRSLQYTQQPKKKFNWDNFYKVAGLVTSVVLTILIAISLKPLLGGLGKKNTPKTLFENYKNDESIITLSKLPGMEEAKQQFQTKVINPLKHRDLFMKEIVDPGMACILHGPPGTGKTNFVKSAAKEVDANVATFALAQEGSAYMYQTSVNLKEKADAIIECAKKEPNREFFVLFDEIESILAESKNLDSNTALSRQEVIKTYLQVMDSFKKYKNIKVFATTNLTLNTSTGKIGNMNEAAMSRFGTKIFVDNPDKEALKSAVKMYLEKYPSAKELLENQEAIEALSQQLVGASFRDVTHIIDNAVELMMQQKLAAANANKDPEAIKLTQEMFEDVIEYFQKTNRRFGAPKMKEDIAEAVAEMPPIIPEPQPSIIPEVQPEQTVANDTITEQTNFIKRIFQKLFKGSNNSSTGAASA